MVSTSGTWKIRRHRTSIAGLIVVNVGTPLSISFRTRFLQALYNTGLLSFNRVLVYSLGGMLKIFDISGQVVVVAALIDSHPVELRLSSACESLSKLHLRASAPLLSTPSSKTSPSPPSSPRGYRAPSSFTIPEFRNIRTLATRSSLPKVLRRTISPAALGPSHHPRAVQLRKLGLYATTAPRTPSVVTSLLEL